MLQGVNDLAEAVKVTMGPQVFIYSPIIIMNSYSLWNVGFYVTQCSFIRKIKL